MYIYVITSKACLFSHPPCLQKLVICKCVKVVTQCLDFFFHLCGPMDLTGPLLTGKGKHIPPEENEIIHVFCKEVSLCIEWHQIGMSFINSTMICGLEPCSLFYGGISHVFKGCLGWHPHRGVSPAECRGRHGLLNKWSSQLIYLANSKELTPPRAKAGVFASSKQGS